METKNPNVEEKVMSQIKSGKIKLRSKYVFLAEKLGLGSAIALTVLLAVLFFNLVLYYLKASDNLRYLSFGSRGVFAFLQSFPYLLVAGLIVVVFLAAFIVKKSGILYKKPFGRVAVGLVCFILALGAVLTFTGINERIERHAFGPRPTGMFFRPFLSHGIEHRGNGTAGRVAEAGDGFIVIETPRGTEKIDTTKLETPIEIEFVPGSFLVAIGERDKDVFIARSIKVFNKGEMPMIEHGINRHFGEHMPPPPPGMFFPAGSDTMPCGPDNCPMNNQ